VKNTAVFYDYSVFLIIIGGFLLDFDLCAGGGEFVFQFGDFVFAYAFLWEFIDAIADRLISV